MPLERTLSNYAYCIENFYPGDGEAGYINSERRYLETQWGALSEQDKRKLAEIDAMVPAAAAKATGTWEEDEMLDLVEFIQQERRSAA